MALAGVLSGCASDGFDPATGLYARPIGGAPATENDTAYSEALRCLATRAREQGRESPRLAVGDISDLTGRSDFETGRKISQGASLFAVTALTKAGVPTVERQDRGVSEVERQYAQAHLLSDSPDAAGQSADNFRPVFAGQIAGSRYYVVGGVSELNYNIRSSGVDISGGSAETAGLSGGLTHSGYVMNIAIDLRLIDTTSQEVLATSSYQKQLVGRETRIGVFDFLNGNIFDLSAGTGGFEPIQFAVRTAVERGLYDFAADIYGLPRDSCIKEPEPSSEVTLLAQRSTSERTQMAAASTPARVQLAAAPRELAPARGPALAIDPRLLASQPANRRSLRDALPTYAGRPTGWAPRANP
jgi:curli production assembly/transport component CsgG/holdfast attachment protein HfaB